MEFLLALGPALVASAPAAGDGQAAAGLFTPEFTLTIATWITFGLFIFIIAKYGWGPITRSLDERERLNRENAERAEAARREAESLLAEHRERLAGTQAEIDRILGEGRARGEEIGVRLRAEAVAATEAMTARARDAIEKERLKALVELRAVAAEAAIQLAGRILEEEIDPQRHEKLIEKTVSRLPSH